MEKRLIDYQDLSRAQKIDHIWEYYKIHIIGGICLVFLIGWMLNHYIINPPPTVSFDVTFFGDYGDNQNLKPLKEQMDQALIEKGVNEEINVEFLSTSENLDINMQQATVTKMMAKASMSDYDILIFEGESYELFLRDDALYSLEQLMNTGRINLEGEKLLSNVELQSKEAGIFLIDVSRIKLFKTFYDSNKPIYMGIYKTSKHLDKMAGAMDFLLNEIE